MPEKVTITIELRPEEYRVMASKADQAGMPLRRLIEASISRACRPSKVATLSARVQAIVDLHGTGLNDREIAERLGLTQSAVYYHRHSRLGLPKNDNRGGGRSKEQPAA